MNPAFRAPRPIGGYTLIELLVTIMIIGILSAIILPSILRYANGARHSEAKTMLSTINRAQQSYRTEYSEFSPEIGYLAIGVSNTGYFSYSVAVLNASYGTAYAAPTNSRPLLGYSAGVYIDTLGDIDSRICETITSAHLTTIEAPQVNADQNLVCGGTMRDPR